MPRIKTERELILKSAIEVIRRGRPLNARNIAAELKSSTQPIYSVFKNLDELKIAMLPEIAKIQKTKVEIYLAQKDIPQYKAYGMGFVRFAKDESELFKLLYCEQPKSLFRVEQDYLYDEIFPTIQSIFNISREEAKNFHLDMSIYTYGLAVMQSLGNNFSDDEVSQALTREFQALSLRLKKGE